MASRPTVLVPLRILEGDSLPEGTPELLSNGRVLLLGYHVIPEQTAPGQARVQFEDRALTRLKGFEELLEGAGAHVESRLVFTHNAQQSIDRTLTEHDCIAILVPNATGPPADVLVGISDAVGIDRLIRLTAGLFADTEISVTLLGIEPDSEENSVRPILEDVASRLHSAGFDPTRIDIRFVRDRDPLEAVSEIGEAFEAIVLVDPGPSLISSPFGVTIERFADRFLGPVLLVQREASD